MALVFNGYKWLKQNLVTYENYFDVIIVDSTDYTTALSLFSLIISSSQFLLTVLSKFVTSDIVFSVFIKNLIINKIQYFYL